MTNRSYTPSASSRALRSPSRARTEATPWLVASVAAGSLAACASPDPDGRLDEHIARVEASLQDTSPPTDTTPVPDTSPTDTTPPSDTDLVCDPIPFDPAGDWYLIVSATLDRERPFYIRTTFVPEDGGTYTATFQPLKSDDTIDPNTAVRTPRTDRRTPTGDPIVATGVDLDGDTFSIAVNDLILDDDANPVTGRLVRGDVTLTGSFRDYTTSCGDVTGDIVEPLTLPLGGSTFTLFRAEDFNAVDEIPINCEQLPAPQPPPLEDCELEPPVDPCDAFDPVGSWLLAVSATLDRERPLLLELDVTSAGAAYDFLFQPLATDEAIDADTGGRAPRDNPRVPVGDPIQTTGVSVNLTTGAFTVTVTDLTVDDDANPITGRLIRGDVTLTGSFRANDWACGDVTGDIVEPLTLPLNGSTFAIVRTDDPVSISPVRYNCEQLPSPLECSVPR
jgi:hypothetical protein